SLISDYHPFDDANRRAAAIVYTNSLVRCLEAAKCLADMPEPSTSLSDSNPSMQKQDDGDIANVEIPQVPTYKKEEFTERFDAIDRQITYMQELVVVCIGGFMRVSA